MGQGENIFISVIMTALNEERDVEASIVSVLRVFDDCSIDGELILINDGSTDKTGDIAKALVLKDARIRVVAHDKPCGVGASFWDGVDVAYGKVVVWFPADNENDPWEIMRYHKLLEHVDVVIPFVFNRQARPAFRNILSLVYRVIINTTFHVNFNYTNGTIMYCRQMLKELDFRNKGFFFQTDILIRVVKRGYLFAEVPYRLLERKNGKSKAVTFPSFVRVVRGYWNLVCDYYFKKNIKSCDNFAKNSSTAERRS